MYKIKITDTNKNRSSSFKGDSWIGMRLMYHSKKREYKNRTEIKVEFY